MAISNTGVNQSDMVDPGTNRQEEALQEEEFKLMHQNDTFHFHYIFNHIILYVHTLSGLISLYLDMILPGCLTSPIWDCHWYNEEKEKKKKTRQKSLFMTFTAYFGSP